MDRSVSGLTVVRAAGLTGLVRRASDHAAGELGSERLLPVLPELRELLPGRGLRRGATVAVATVSGPTVSGPTVSGPTVSGPTVSGPTVSGPSVSGPSVSGPVSGGPVSGPTGSGVGATSLLLALLAGASRAGSWCAVVGVPALSPVAAAELGIALDRLALVPYPGPDWTAVVAALLDGFDIVVAAPPGPIARSVAGRLTARARQRGSVLISYGGWQGAEITFEAVHGRWHGLGWGRGRLRGRQLTVLARGRGAAAAPRRIEMWLPKESGPLAAPVGSVDAGGTAGAGRPALTVLPGTGSGSWSSALPTGGGEDHELQEATG